MWIRRAFYWVQLAAIVVLPSWIMIARSISPSGLGTQDLLVFLAWPALTVSMIVVLGVTWARKSVRSTKTLSWTDVVSLGIWYLIAIAYGVFVSQSAELAAGLTGGMLALASLAVFAIAVWQLMVAARRRVETVFASLDYTALPQGEYRATRLTPAEGDVIRIDPADR
jgi:tryptophan-rich sensory protein